MCRGHMDAENAHRFDEGIAFFHRPRYEVVATGEGDTGTSGAGFLRSMDGGKTWHVLDSTVNVDNQDNILPMSSAQRDHRFVGSTAFNILVDPKAVALYRLSKGLMTLYEGSVPLLPRDPTSGYVFAGAASPCTRLILTLEPFSIDGAPSVVLCVWYGGHVALQLDLKRVYCNVMADRNYKASKDQGENTSTTP